MVDGIRGVGRAPAECCWIDGCDRGGDYFEAMQESQQPGREFLMRIHQDRRVRVPELDEATGVVLDWWLTTSSPIESPEAALQAVSDYEWRWSVAEEYHSETIAIVGKGTKASRPPQTVGRLGRYLGRKGDGPPGW